MTVYVNNVSVKIEFSFLLIIAFSIVTGNTAVCYILLFSALHELGHIFMLYVLGGKADSIIISYYGIGLRYSSKLNDLKMFLFLIGGVAVNLLFALLNVKRSINFALFAINILPIYPLDGGRALKLILNNLFNISLSSMIFTAISAVVIVGLIVYSVFTKNISLALIAIYIIIYSINNSFD